VRVIQIQPSIETLSQRQQARKRREIAIHAEDRISHDQLVRRIAGGQQALQCGEIVVRIAAKIRARKLHGVVKRGVVEFVGKNRITPPHQRRHHGQIGHIAGAERKGRWLADHTGKALFHGFVRGKMAAHQMRSATPHTPARSTSLGGSDQVGMGGEPQIIVAAKIN